MVEKNRGFHLSFVSTSFFKRNIQSRHVSGNIVLVTFINTNSDHSKMMKSHSYHDDISVVPNSNICFSQVSNDLPLDFDQEANCLEYYRSVMNDTRESVEYLI